MPRPDKFFPDLKVKEKVLPPDLSKGRKLEMDGLYVPSFKERLLILFGGVIVARCTAFTSINPGHVVNQMDVDILPETDTKKVKLRNRLASYLHVRIQNEKNPKPTETEEIPLPNQV